MITIAEPNVLVDRFWSINEYPENSNFRLMCYVLRVDYCNEVCLHNVVTGQLVKLNQEETKMLDSLPCKANEVMDSLIQCFFLVPVEFDEHQKVNGIRHILRYLEDCHKGRGIFTYTILPTTACNARCWYCFEKNLASVTMSEQTADEVISFITKNSKGQKVWIKWFGGEPTVSSKVIDQICIGLKRNGVVFSSRMTTNAYLFDENMIERAKEIWNLTTVRISIDGTEANYNRIKSYINVQDNPYKRIMKNISIFVEQGINVQLRMNIDNSNYMDFYELLSELGTKYKASKLLQVFVHQINDYSKELDKNQLGARENWYNQKIYELNNASRSADLLRDNDLPSLRFDVCDAANKNAITITPNGNLVNCPERIDPDMIVGNIYKGVTNDVLSCSWRRFADYEKCYSCVLYPECVRFEKCTAKDKCYLKQDKISRYQKSIINYIDTH